MKHKVIKDCKIGKHTKIYDFVNLYGCEIGENCMIGTFVEIQKGVKIGDKVKVSSHSFICGGVTLEDEVFIGHHVVFTNDKYPRATKNGELQREGDWESKKTVVCEGASIGSNVTVLPGIKIGKKALVGAGSVVTKDVSEGAIVVGNPAKIIR